MTVDLADTEPEPVAAGARGARSSRPIGHYELERELGRGGMGVVYAAFDTELQRRVAIKLLRPGASDTARARLLREARAMARLTHPNVVTVYEVASSGSHDYIAMEIIDGESLADWLKGGKRSRADIVEAFVAAGRGLAAAHAAGVIHRDFKPHNVLRAHGGRVVVTDFGLAREAGASDADADAGPDTSPPLVTLTRSGTVVGTPAYMAPEQWRGGALSSATDQFAYCIALWEALTGSRPFRGGSGEALRAATESGPTRADAAKLPGWARAVLLRGLAPDPDRRWRSMDEVVTRLRHARWLRVALPVAAVGAIGIGLVAGAVAIAATRAPAGEPCRTPAAGSAAEADLGRDRPMWLATRIAACRRPEPAREPQLACLDAVAARAAVIARAAAREPETTAEELAHLAIDPAVCGRDAPPRLVALAGEPVIAAFATWIRSDSGLRDPGDAGAVASDPCAVAIYHQAASEDHPAAADRRAELAVADPAAARCGDDRVLADVAIERLSQLLQGTTPGPEIAAAFASADAAVARVGQPDLVGRLAAFRAEDLRRRDRLDDAIAAGVTAADGFRHRWLASAAVDLELRALDMMLTRARPDDLRALSGELDALRAYGADSGMTPDDLASIDLERARWWFARGDVAGATATLRRLETATPAPPDARVRRLTGVVVDATGAPVPGASVAVGPPALVGTATSAAAIDGRLWSGGENFPGLHDVVLGVHRVVADGHGAFAIDGAQLGGLAIAERGGDRSDAEPIGDGELRLVLAPTCQVDGEIELRGVPAAHAYVHARADAQPATVRYDVIAPLAADGRFELAGAPCGRLQLGVSILRATPALLGSVTVDADGGSGVRRGVAIESRLTARDLAVVVRSTVDAPLPNAEVFVVAGAVPATLSLRALREQTRAGASVSHFAVHVTRADASPPVAAALRDGDLAATLRRVPVGAISACALGFPDFSDHRLADIIERHQDDIQASCVPVAAGDAAVVIAVPPWPRLD